MTSRLPEFDLVTATVDRTRELSRLLDSLESQTYRCFRLILVDQNEDDRLAAVLAGRPLSILRLPSARGLSRARNVGLAEVRADVVAFPDDDCVYPSDLLERVAHRFAEHPALGGLSGKAVDEAGRFDRGWSREPGQVELDNVWHRGISFAIFLRREVVERVGSFDERLGLGSVEAWASGEEIDYLIRAVRAGVRVEYDPSLVVLHDLAERTTPGLRAVGRRDGASVGYLLRKHRYPPRTLARMLVRPVGGVLVSLARLDTAQAGFHASTLRGRLLGYRGGRDAV